MLHTHFRGCTLWHYINVYKKYMCLCVCLCLRICNYVYLCVCVFIYIGTSLKLWEYVASGICESRVFSCVEKGKRAQSVRAGSR